MPRGKHNGHVRGADHYRWQDGHILSSHGYVKIRVGQSHPLADPHGYAYEHRLVLASAGVELPQGHVVHHRNGVKTDNRFENLAVITKTKHVQQHNAIRPRDARGRFTG